MKKYLTLKKEYQQAVDKLDFLVAFKSEDFQEIMRLKQLHRKLYGVGWGCYCTEQTYEKLDELTKKLEGAIQKHIDNKDSKWIQDAIYYEMSNHEYPYSYDDEEVLKPLGLTLEAFNDEWFKGVRGKAYRKLLTDYDW